jgi:hypothetical protein
MHALAVLLDGVSNRDFVTREEFTIAVADRAGIRQILIGYRRGRVTSRANGVKRAVTARTLWRIGIAGLRRLGMDARFKFFNLLCVAFRAFCRGELRGRGHFVHIPMTRGASCLAKHPVCALGDAGGLFGMARRAAHLGDFLHVRKVLDRSVTILASQNAMRAGGVLARVNRNGLARFRFHPGLAVTRQTGFVLRERLRSTTARRVKHRQQ